MTLTPEQAAAEGLPPGPPQAAPVLSAKDAEAEGLPASGPVSDASASSEPGIGAKILHFLATPPPVTDKYANFVKSTRGPDAITDDSPDWKAAIGSAAKGFPGLIPSFGGEDRIAKFEQEHPGIALALGFAGPGGMKKTGAAAQAAQTGGGIMDKLRAWSQGLGRQVEDKAAKAAEATAASAKGTHGAAVANASRTIERLGMENGLPEADAALNQAALGTPEAQTLASKLAEKARGTLPGQLGHMESTGALAAQTAEDATKARLPENVQQYADQVLKQRTRTQLKRYALPIAGATYGAISGDGDMEHRAGRGALFGIAGAGLAGRALSPTFNAVVGNNLLAPERMYRIAPHLVSAAEKVAQLPVSMLGRFAAPIQNAFKRGPNALAAIHYKLSEDPEYQAITRKAAEQQEASHDGAAQ